MLHSAEQARGRQVARILYASRHKAPVSLNALQPSLMRRAVAWAFPALFYKQGLCASLMPLLSCSVVSLKHWLHGRREMPDRVRLILIATIENRLEAGAAVLAELKAAQPGPKPNPANRLHSAKARKAKAADDAAKHALDKA